MERRVFEELISSRTVYSSLEQVRYSMFDQDREVGRRHNDCVCKVFDPQSTASLDVVGLHGLSVSLLLFSWLRFISYIIALQLRGTHLFQHGMFLEILVINTHLILVLADRQCQ